MENEGGQGSKGSHFEKVVFGPELMIAEISYYPKITKMSLAVAQDSGFYLVDMKKGENYHWGKDEGCDMFNMNCSDPAISEYCSAVGSIGCSDNHMYITICSTTQFNNTCPINLHIISCKEKRNTNYRYKFGKNSVCLLVEVGYWTN